VTLGKIFCRYSLGARHRSPRRRSPLASAPITARLGADRVPTDSATPRRVRRHGSSRAKAQVGGVRPSQPHCPPHSTQPAIVRAPTSSATLHGAASTRFHRNRSAISDSPRAGIPNRARSGWEISSWSSPRRACTRLVSGANRDPIGLKTGELAANSGKLWRRIFATDHSNRFPPSAMIRQ
jgi:hypothetical protein